MLTERTRRLWAAAEAESIGHGGIALVARSTGISRARIARGGRLVAELLPELGYTLQANRKTSLDRVLPARVRTGRCAELRDVRVAKLKR